MEMGVGAYERVGKTGYTIRRWIFLTVILATWCRGEVVSHS